MHFCLVDRVLERTDGRIVTLKQVSAAEEYLQDHFPGFPVLPGVFMVESLVQAAQELLRGSGENSGDGRWVLGSVRALKYGSFVRPGESLRIEVTLHKRAEGGVIEFKGEGVVVRTGSASTDEPQVAVSGRFTLRPVCVE